MDGGIEVILGELIEMVQATAPALWAIARRQVLANTIGNAVWGGLCFLIATALVWTTRYSSRRWKNRRETPAYDDWTWESAAWVAGAFAVLALVATLFFTNSFIMYSISPDYYAIKVLLQLVR